MHRICVGLLMGSALVAGLGLGQECLAQGYRSGVPYRYDVRQADRRADLSERDGRALPVPQWRLGVSSENRLTGVEITRVSPNSPAATAGLERGDIIVTVNGHQVGTVGGRIENLSAELASHADRNGRVQLLVQSRRTLRLAIVDVRLEPRR